MRRTGCSIGRTMDAGIATTNEPFASSGAGGIPQDLMTVRSVLNAPFPPNPLW